MKSFLLTVVSILFMVVAAAFIIEHEKKIGAFEDKCEREGKSLLVHNSEYYCVGPINMEKIDATIAD